MTSIPDYVVKRIKTPANLKYIVEKSTPVVCFGDITSAEVLTIGINPSSSEFTKISNGERVLLSGTEMRLADLESVGAMSTETLTDNQVEKVWHHCLDYFDGPYYEKWFSRMQETVLNPLKVSYVARTAAHLDLIQWATDPLWKEMLEIDPAAANEHLSADLPFLEQQVEDSLAKVIFLSGSPVIDALGRKFNLQDFGKTQVNGKRQQYKLYLGKWRNALILGSSMNIPDSHTSNEHRAYLSNWIASQYR